jgi:hypothetical protein
MAIYFLMAKTIMEVALKGNLVVSVLKIYLITNLFRPPSGKTSIGAVT